MSILIYSKFLGKSVEELKDKVCWNEFVLENVDENWEQWYVRLDGDWNLYLTAEIVDGRRVISCVNLYDGDELVGGERL